MTRNSPNTQNQGHGKEPIDSSLDWDSVDVPIRKSCFSFPQKKDVITIILIGETGSGKTCFMSLLLNLFEGNGPFQLQEKQFVDAQSGLDRSQSQTTEARVYSFTTVDGVKVEILDTPGLADTRGLDEDKKHRERIYRAIQELITEVDGVMIIANGTVERLTLATDYTLNILATWFPRSIIDNIGIIFTNTVMGEDGLNFRMENLPPALQNVDYWCLNNPLSLYKKFSAPKAGRSSGGSRGTSTVTLEANYKETINVLNNWLEWLDERKVIPTTAIIDLYQKSSYIESRLFATVTSIAYLSKSEFQLSDISSNLQTAEKQKGVMSNLKKTLPSRVWALEETSHHNTICTAPDCHSNCHPKCSLELGDSTTIGGSCRTFKTLIIPNKWLPFWSNAEVKCGQPKCRHEARQHRYYQQIHKMIDNEAYKRIVQDLQDYTTEKEMLEKIKDRVESEIKRVQEEIEQSKREIPGLIKQINSLSLSPNYAGYIWSALDILRMRKEQSSSRHDSGKEIQAINEGIKALEAQLVLLQESEVGRVVNTSHEV